MNASTALVTGFVILFTIMYLAIVASVWRATRNERWTALTAAGLAVWLTVTGLLAARGVTANFTKFPPPLLRLVAITVVITVVLAVTTFGSRLVQGLSLGGLVAFQSFRLPLEMLMYRAYTEGVMPPQMSCDGLNPDILTGASAIVVALLIGRLPRWVPLAWNAVGFVLLLNVVTVAILSVPGPLRIFEHPNTWVGYLPFIWLPTLLVPTALMGHILIWRKWRQECV